MPKLRRGYLSVGLVSTDATHTLVIKEMGDDTPKREVYTMPQPLDQNKSIKSKRTTNKLLNITRFYRLGIRHSAILYRCLSHLTVGIKTYLRLEVR